MFSWTLLEGVVFSAWKIWKGEKIPCSVWFLVFPGAHHLFSPAAAVSTSFLSLFFSFPSLSFSRIHPRSIVCILDAHTLYPKRIRTRVRVYEYAHNPGDWKYFRQFCWYEIFNFKIIFAHLIVKQQSHTFAAHRVNKFLLKIEAIFYQNLIECHYFTILFTHCVIL